MDFSEALRNLKAGQPVARTGWNGAGQFVYYVPAASYPVQTGVAKRHFGEGTLVPYRAYLALKTVDGSVATWQPSVSDVLADDWVVLDDVGQAAPARKRYTREDIHSYIVRDNVPNWSVDISLRMKDGKELVASMPMMGNLLRCGDTDEDRHEAAIRFALRVANGDVS